MTIRLFLVLCCFVLHTAHADEPSTAEIDRTPDARLTLELRDAPLLQVLHLLSQTGVAKFRYGVPPDAVVSVRWNDETPMRSLDASVQNAGWQLQRAGGDFFLIPAPNSAAPNAAFGTWTQWKGSAPPPREALTGTSAIAKIALQNARIVSQKATVNDADWKAIEIALDAARAPGILLVAPHFGQKETWLRSVVMLKVVPRGTRLMLESGENCDVLINGAPLARNWRGIRTFDVEPLLKRGANTIVVRQRALKSASTSSTLRYEWVFAGGAGNGGLPGESTRDLKQ